MTLLDEHNIEVDPRFERARQEAKVVLAYMAAFGIVVISTAIWGSLSYHGSFEYIYGFPKYLFVIFIETLIFVIIGYTISMYYIEDVPLKAWMY